MQYNILQNMKLRRSLLKLNKPDSALKVLDWAIPKYPQGEYAPYLQLTRIAAMPLLTFTAAPLMTTFGARERWTLSKPLMTNALPLSFFCNPIPISTSCTPKNDTAQSYRRSVCPQRTSLVYAEIWSLARNEAFFFGRIG